MLLTTFPNAVLQLVQDFYILWSLEARTCLSSTMLDVDVLDCHIPSPRSREMQELPPLPLLEFHRPLSFLYPPWARLAINEGRTIRAKCINAAHEVDFLSFFFINISLFYSHFRLFSNCSFAASYSSISSPCFFRNISDLFTWIRKQIHSHYLHLPSSTCCLSSLLPCLAHYLYPLLYKLHLHLSWRSASR